jgi:hypothetical protein
MMQNPGYRVAHPGYACWAIMIHGDRYKEPKLLMAA